MQSHRSLSLLDAVPSIHAADCQSWGQAAGAVSGPAITPDLPDDVAAYAAGARAVYSDLRRLVGQLAGLLILAQASNRREAFDLPTLVAARELWQSLPERLDGLRAPGRLDANAYQLRATHRLLGDCLEALRDPRLNGDDRPDLSAAMAGLARAYTHLQAASEPRVGMTMVDFSHACCNCGQARQ